MDNHWRVHGVTLIELLVVVTIMMTVLGLVGGVTIESVRKASAQTEVISIYSIIKKSSVKAFTFGSSLEMSVSGDRLKILLGENIYAETQFDHLQFDPQKITFSRNGMPDTFSLSVRVRGLDKKLDLLPLFDNPTIASGNVDERRTN